ncbi:MAG TPA: tetratricopeptide repeat protein [Gemmataceae bacterium]|nr:tetratricopeptide repeat protein [Gemmataceae bacterium]
MAAETVEHLFQQAREAMERGNWEKSRQLYLHALNLKPDSPDIHYGLATVCFQMNDLPSAAYHFKEVTRLDPLRAGAYVNLGAVYNLLGQLDDAIAVLRRGIQLDPQRAEGYYNLGLVYRRKGQANLAMQAYQECLRVNPRMADAHFNLANLHMERREYAQAAAHYKVALQLRPTWDKAAAGLEQAQEALAEAQLAEGEPRPAEQPSSRTAPADAEHVIDPRQGSLLSSLHKATIESENHGRHFLRILETEIEPVLKELSSCLLYPDSPAGELDACVHKFESAIQNMRSAHRNLQTSIEKLRTIGDRLLRR